VVDRLVVVWLLLAQSRFGLAHVAAELLDLLVDEAGVVHALGDASDCLLGFGEAPAQVLERRRIVGCGQIIGPTRRDLLAHLLDRAKLLANLVSSALAASRS
jgi:hypothetical protein